MNDSKEKQLFQLHDVITALSNSVKKAEQAMVPKTEDDRYFMVAEFEIDFPAKLGISAEKNADDRPAYFATMELPKGKKQAAVSPSLLKSGKEDSESSHDSLADSHLARIRLKLR